MCKFISWIETKGRVYFITDAELSTKRGKGLADAEGDMPIGHGFIRAYFHRRFTNDFLTFGNYLEAEYSWFTKPDKFPPVIVRALKEGRFTLVYPCVKGILTKAAWEKFQRDSAPLTVQLKQDRKKLYIEPQKLNRKYISLSRRINTARNNGNRNKLQKLFPEQDSLYQIKMEAWNEAYKKDRDITHACDVERGKMFWGMVRDANNRCPAWK